MSAEDRNLFGSKFLWEVLDKLKTNLFIAEMETGRILFMNQKMKKVFGLEHPEGHACWEVLQRNQSGRCSFCKIGQLLEKKEENCCVWHEVSSLNGRIYENTDSLVNWRGKQYFVQYSSDITDLTRLTESVNVDELTRMMTRRAGKENLGKMIERARQEQKSIAVALCDVNELKQVNDLYGHGEGDRLLRFIAKALRENAVRDDLRFRLSGDEFILAFYDQEAEAAEEKIRLMQESLSRERKEKGICYKVSFSYGLMTVYPTDQYTMQEVIARVDELMYIQKRNYHIQCQKKKLEEAGVPQRYTEKFEYDREHLYEALADSTDDYIFIGNMKTGVFRYPPAMVEEFGLPGEVVDHAAAFWGNLIHPHDEQGFLESNQEIADGRAESHDIEYRAKNVRGEWIWLKCRGRMIRDEMGQPDLFAGMITNLGKNNKKDHLTGLLNRFEFEGAIKKHLVDEGPDRKMVVMVLDLDSFKNINDLYNRSFGDEILRITASRIVALLPANAKLYRMDGDEFGMMILDGGEEEAREIFRRIQRSFHRQQEHNGRKYYCTLSAGCVKYPEHGDNYLDLMKYANYSLEYSKMMGKNRLTVFSPDILKKKERKLELQELLWESIERGFVGFSVNYQPLVYTSTGQIRGAEALARWQCSKYGKVSPGEFIPLLEKNGAVVQMGNWIFSQAVHQCRKWQEVVPDFHMNINLSYRQLMDESILSCMKQVLKETGIDPGFVTMELTESYLGQEDGTIRRMIQEIRRLGFRMAMDDFGTGYSSLASLKKIPVDEVKIDQRFVDNVREDPFNATVIRFITELCHDVGKEVCLEGLETQSEYDTVRDMGIEFSQGYYFGHPVPPEEFEKQFLVDRKKGIPYDSR